MTGGEGNGDRDDADDPQTLALALQARQVELIGNLLLDFRTTPKEHIDFFMDHSGNRMAEQIAARLMQSQGNDPEAE